MLVRKPGERAANVRDMVFQGLRRNASLRRLQAKGPTLDRRPSAGKYLKVWRKHSPDHIQGAQLLATLAGGKIGPGFNRAHDVGVGWLDQ
jgi:hypothetical protein